MTPSSLGRTNGSDPLLEVKDLRKYFPIKRGFFSRVVVGHVKAVDDVNFKVNPGETMGLVGESGCGKTTTGRVILRALVSQLRGEIWFRDKEMGACQYCRV